METERITQVKAKQMVVDCKDGKFFTVEFVKRTTGEIRVMNCRKGVHKGVNGNGLKFEPMAKDLVGVFDIPKKQYRFISLDEIKSVRINKKRYIVES